MDIKELRIRTDLTQREFGERICVQSQTILKYEKKERKVPASIQRLIRYEFAKYLPEGERLIPDLGEQTISPNPNQELEKYLEENTELKDQLRELPHIKKENSLLEGTIGILKDQVRMYKEQLGITNGNGKIA